MLGKDSRRYRNQKRLKARAGGGHSRQNGAAQGGIK